MKKRVLIPFITFNVLVILALAGLFVLSEAYPLRPGSPVYRLQHAAEQWRMRLTAGQASRAAMALNLAERRLGDLAQAGEQAEPTPPPLPLTAPWTRLCARCRPAPSPSRPHSAAA